MKENLQAKDPLEAPFSSQAEERVSVASNWKLVWWRFRRNRLAVASAVVLLMFYTIVLVPEFFSTQDPEKTEAFLAFIPIQRISFRDGGRFNLSVPAVAGKRNAVTLRMEWVTDWTQRIPIGFFVHGYRYRVLGLFQTDIHLLGPRDSGSGDRAYFLGTDRLGRDQWSRLMFGTRTSMTVGLVAVALSVFLGLLLGGI
jgi:peptide/nickel transport system permease protein